MKLVNLMKHNLNILNQATGLVEEYEGRGEMAAGVDVYEEPVECTSEYSVFRNHYGHVYGLPSPQQGTFYVVSMLTKEAAKAAGRKDVVSPSTGPTAVRIKDGPMKGQIDYVVSLSA